MQEMARKLVWYAFKLPLLLSVILIGFIFEYLVMLPFMAICLLNGAGPAHSASIRRRHP